MFFTFFRKSNVLPESKLSFDYNKQVSRDSITCSNSCLLVKSTWSKTNQCGDRVLIVPVCSVPGSKLCPVTAYKRLLHMVPSSVNIPAFSYFDRAGKLVPLTYSTFVQQLRVWLSRIGIVDTSRYGSHSFRRGGTTLAFQSGVDPVLIKAQGDWSSECYRRYVKLSISDKLHTTRSMAKALSMY